jgi:hypothetical protein
MADQLVPPRFAPVPPIQTAVQKTRPDTGNAVPEHTSRTASLPTTFADIRARLVWLSANISMLRMLCETRLLTAAETLKLAQFRDESDRLQAVLTELRETARQN